MKLTKKFDFSLYFLFKNTNIGLLLCICGVFLSSNRVSAQTVPIAKSVAKTVTAPASDTLHLQANYSINIAAERIELDRLGNVYAFANGEWHKFNVNDTIECCRFAEHGLEAADVFDVSNPQKIIVYQPALQRGKILDRTLSVENSFDFSANIANNITLLGAALDDNVWAVDYFQHTLLKIDRNTSNFIKKSDNIGFAPNVPMLATCLRESSDAVYLSLPVEGVFVFDSFGNYQKTLPLKNLTNFQLINDKIVWYSNQKIHTFDSNSLQSVEQALPFLIQQENKVAFGKGILAISRATKIEIYIVLKR